ncbi:hypothetical protein AB751O23_AK_00190 [Chlamydiales bacterium SCGC AB-751-O23]|jgi:hypothetical protein|nr:hypothetical protein AB751O23_AK_00190 [Chlamydiales bacterium SCGC AB-751-O23]
MKINDRILSIPPYISTTWDNVISIQVIEKDTVLITLLDGTKVKAPGLNDADIKHIFQSHIKYVEAEEEEEHENNLKFALSEAADSAKEANHLSPQDLLSKLLLSSPKDSLDIPIQLGMDEAQGLGLGMQHNPMQKNAPKLPIELLKKVSNIAKIFAEDKFSVPEVPSETCNCFYCQIVRAMQPEEEEEELDINEPVKDEELKFRLWDILDSGNQTYHVTNPLDAAEEYWVYLKPPVGCTCGKKDCEHVKSVLES